MSGWFGWLQGYRGTVQSSLGGCDLSTSRAGGNWNPSWFILAKDWDDLSRFIKSEYFSKMGAKSIQDEYRHGAWLLSDVPGPVVLRGGTEVFFLAWLWVHICVTSEKKVGNFHGVFLYRRERSRKSN